MTNERVEKQPAPEDLPAEGAPIQEIDGDEDEWEDDEAEDDETEDDETEDDETEDDEAEDDEDWDDDEAGLDPALAAAPTYVAYDGDFRAGFACLVGRPNAGKSTLTNAIVGEKVAITSSKPQTTRHTIRGVWTGEKAQVVLVDTPGLHKPRTLLGQRLNDLVRETLLDVDVVGFCLPSDQRIGPGDTFIANELKELQRVRRTPVVAIATKADLVDKKRLAEHLIAIDQLGEWAAIVPCSGTRGDQVSEVIDELAAQLPTSPPLYPEGMLTDEPQIVMIAELVREAALEGVRDELPHSLAVTVEEMVERENRRPGQELLDVRVSIFVERDSQKAIVIGRGGSRLREVGTNARAGIEKLLGRRIHLDLHVKVAKDWQRDPKQLHRLGF